jgi:RluA family pseudouridine synthase
MTLLAFIKKKEGERYSNRQIKRAIESNQCQVNGRTERHASTLVGSGDEIAFTPLSEAISTQVEAERILYEDSALIVYNKPAGIACDSEGLEKMVRKYCLTALLVHRLDRDTTGIVILAKNVSVKEAMKELFRKHEVEKTYYAIVDGIPKEKEGRIENFLGKVHTYQGQGLWGVVGEGSGLPACTLWDCVQKGKEASLIRCMPITGRTHQLRVHLSSIGHPILGDYQYCQAFRCSHRPKRLLLHAAEICFISPGSNKEVFLQASWPADFQSSLEILSIQV